MQWYEVQRDQLDADIRSRLLLSHFDRETELFVKNSRDKSDSILLQLYYSCAVTFLKVFLTQTSVNG